MLEWFAERVDRIILLFDAHKLDISDEFSEVIKALKNHEDKIRCWLVIRALVHVDHRVAAVLSGWTKVFACGSAAVLCQGGAEQG